MLHLHAYLFGAKSIFKRKPGLHFVLHPGGNTHGPTKTKMETTGNLLHFTPNYTTK